MRFSSLALLLSLVVMPAASAQIAYVLGDFPTGFTAGVNLPTSGFPAGSPDFRGPLPIPVWGASGFTPFVPIPAGGHAIDQVTATVYSSDGMILVSEAHTLYLPAGGPPAVPVFGILPGGGPLTGLGCNSAVGGALYICNAIAFQPRSKVFPYAPTGAPVVPTFPHAPFTGIGYDPATATIWLVDMVGRVFHCTTAGVGIGPQPVAVVASIFGTPMIGLDVNTSNGVGSFPEPLCSTALPGYHICVSDGAFVYDALFAANPPIAVSSAGFGPRGYGLAFSSDSQDLRGGVICPSTGMPLVNGLNRPSVVGLIPGPTTAITCSGLLPFGTATIWIDACPVLGGIPLGSAGTLFINPFAPPISGGATANASGVATVFMPLAFAPANVTFACQWFAFDPINPPLFVCLSNATIVTSGLP